MIYQRGTNGKSCIIVISNGASTKYCGARSIKFHNGGDKINPERRLIIPAPLKFYRHFICENIKVLSLTTSYGPWTDGRTPSPLPSGEYRISIFPKTLYPQLFRSGCLHLHRGCVCPGGPIESWYSLILGVGVTFIKWVWYGHLQFSGVLQSCYAGQVINRYNYQIPLRSTVFLSLEKILRNSPISTRTFICLYSEQNGNWKTNEISFSLKYSLSLFEATMLWRKSLENRPNLADCRILQAYIRFFNIVVL